MKVCVWKPWILPAIFLFVMQPAFAATGFSVDSKKLDFGVHDIGTTTERTIGVTNNSDKAIDLKVEISGTATAFSWTKNCLKGLQPKSPCQITVSFTPTVASTPDAQTTAKMTISPGGGGSESEEVSLTGVAVANLTISAEKLDFRNQLINSSSAPRILTITNNTGKALSNLQVIPAGDFTENHSGCQTVNAGAACVISVVFSPKHAGPNPGALTVSVSSTDPVVGSRLVTLSGEGVLQCDPIKFAYGSGAAVVILVCGFYFLGLVLVRWHMIAKPTRLQLRAQILAIRSRLEAETATLPATPEVNERKKRINCLLDWALFPIKTKNDPMSSPIEGVSPTKSASPLHSRFFNALFWTRGHELAGWSLCHEAEEQLIALLPLERVRARMETAEQQLRQINSTRMLAMADRLRDALQSGDIILQEKLRALLTQATVLQQVDAPQAAQRALLANSLRKAFNFLDGFVSWVQTATANAAPTLDECQTRLTQFRQKFIDWSTLNQEISQLLDKWPAMPKPEQSALRSLTTFLSVSGPFATAYKDAGTQTALAPCNSVLTALNQLLTSAQTTTTEISALVQTGQDVAAFKDFLQKSKPHTDLLSSINHSLDPLKAAELLQQINALLDADHTLDQQIAAAASAASTDDVAKFRSVLATFAFSLPMAQNLTSKIKCELDRQLPSVYERWRSLLMEALSQIYDHSDTDFSQLASWHNKLMWLVSCAMLFILALAFTFQNASLLLLGAVGGLLSRLGRNLKAADVENDYGASWGALFLSPVTGALSAWGGILLIILGNKLNVLGAALNLDWCNPYDPMALAVALLFGFSERLFDGVVGQIETKFLKAPPATPGTSPTSGNPKPKITATDPSMAPAGKSTVLTVRGQDFQAGATATFLDKSGNKKPADVVFKDSTTLTVTVNPPASDGYKSTLTVTNPDGQSATVNLNIT